MLAMAAVVIPGAALAQERGRSIEFSAPKSDELSTNLHQLTSKKDSLKQLEEDTYKAIQSFSGMGSLDGVPADPINPNRIVVSTKQIKDAMDRKKNYLWMTPEQLVPSVKVEDLLKLPDYGLDGRDKKSLSPMELYYEKLMMKPGAATPASSYSYNDRGDSLNPFGSTSRDHDEIMAGADVDMPAGLKDSAQSLKKFFMDDDEDQKMPNSTAQQVSFADPFSLGGVAALNDKAQNDLTQKRLTEEYRTMLDPSWKPAHQDALHSFESLFDTQPKDNTALAPNFLTKQPDSDPLLPFTPVSAPLPPGDVTAQALGQSSDSAAFQKPDVTKTAPPRVNFEFPKRPGL